MRVAAQLPWARRAVSDIVSVRLASREGGARTRREEVQPLLQREGKKTIFLSRCFLLWRKSVGRPIEIFRFLEWTSR